MNGIVSVYSQNGIGPKYRLFHVFLFQNSPKRMHSYFQNNETKSNNNQDSKIPLSQIITERGANLFIMF